MKRILFLLVFTSLFLQSCVKDCNCTENSKPKLVVGIVIDQMRYDYLTRYYDRYEENGFKKLLNEGFSLDNAHFNFIPTYTAVGHASIYTGTTPDHHAIIGNWWYDKYAKESIYCVTDSTYTTVGSTSKHGQRSPYRLATTTITDQLKMAQNMNGKTIGIAIKDRSSILPAGHTANAAYWFDSTDESKVVTSSFYMNELPNWVKDFNASNPSEKYVSKPWETLYPIETYTMSMSDDNPYEGTFEGEDKPVFPHDLPKLKAKNSGNGIIKETPFGNSLTLDLAKAAILGENLGKSDYVDFLAVSFSSTDYVGHRYGPNAIETEDTYLRMDKNISELLSFLDTQVGKGNYTIFLTADHGAVQVPSYLQSIKVPAKYFSHKKFNAFLKKVTQEKYGSEAIVEKFSNYQIFLNKEELKRLKLNEDEVSEFLVKQSILHEGVYKAVSAKTLQSTYFASGILNKLQNGYNQKYSGDVMLIPTPATISRGRTGTTHGSGYSYDTHIPIIFYGNGIKPGKSNKQYGVRDIAPTLATLLKTEFPNGTTGQVVDEALKK